MSSTSTITAGCAARGRRHTCALGLSGGTAEPSRGVSCRAAVSTRVASGAKAALWCSPDVAKVSAADIHDVPEAAETREVGVTKADPAIHDRPADGVATGVPYDSEPVTLMSGSDAVEFPWEACAARGDGAADGDGGWDIGAWAGSANGVRTFKRGSLGLDAGSAHARARVSENSVQHAYGPQHSMHRKQGSAGAGEWWHPSGANLFARLEFMNDQMPRRQHHTPRRQHAGISMP